MKILIACLAPLLFYQSCQTNQEQSKALKTFFNNCNELDIVFYSKDTFVFKTTDTSIIKNFTDLISKHNDDLTGTCQTTEKLIYKSKRQQILTAQVSIQNIKDSADCNYISYILDAKMYRHRLTYRTGMGIDEIYSHKIDPQSNPWTGVDTTKFHYEEIKNNR